MIQSQNIVVGHLHQYRVSRECCGVCTAYIIHHHVQVYVLALCDETSPYKLNGIPGSSPRREKYDKDPKVLPNPIIQLCSTVNCRVGKYQNVTRSKEANRKSLLYLRHK